MRFKSLRVFAGEDEVGLLQAGGGATFELGFCSEDGSELQNVIAQIHVEDQLGNLLFTLSTHFTEIGRFRRLPSEGVISCEVDCLPLTAGRDRVQLGCDGDGRCSDNIKNAVQFRVTESDYLGGGDLPMPQRHGTFLVAHRWAEHQLPLEKTRI